MGRIPRKLKLLASVCVVIVSLLLIVALVRHFVFRKNFALAKKNLVTRGQRVNLPNIDWAKNNQTLLLVLNTGCHFCSESAPFYQRLVRDVANRSDLRLVAVMPQAVDEGRKYLNSLGISIDDVRQERSSTVGAQGTPTLILVNNMGIASDVWNGKLPADKETEVLSRLKVR